MELVRGVLQSINPPPFVAAEFGITEHYLTVGYIANGALMELPSVRVPVAYSVFAEIGLESRCRCSSNCYSGSTTTYERKEVVQMRNAKTKRKRELAREREGGKVRERDRGREVI